MTIGERIYTLRKERSISQEELANELNVSRQSVSKWETNQSMPDFDKIVMLCQFFGITTDELLTGKKDIVKADEIDNKNKYAMILGISVGLYIFSAVSVIIFAAVLKQAVLGICLFLTIIAIATGLIVYNSIRYGKKVSKPKKEGAETSQLKTVYELVSLIGLVLYFVISFLTKAWYITWIIFLLIPAVNILLKIIFSFKNDETKEEISDEQNN